VPWSEAAFRHELDIPFSRALVAHPVGDPCTVAGYVVLWCVADEIHLLDLAVAEEFRGRGLGRRLGAEVLAEAGRRDARLVTLEVAEENAAGRALYSALEFATVLLRRDYYGPRAHALVMEWRPHRRRGDDEPAF